MSKFITITEATIEKGIAVRSSIDNEMIINSDNISTIRKKLVDFSVDNGQFEDRTVCLFTMKDGTSHISCESWDVLIPNLNAY